MGNLGAVGHGHKKGGLGDQCRLSSEGEGGMFFMLVKSARSQET